LPGGICAPGLNQYEWTSGRDERPCRNYHSSNSSPRPRAGYEPLDSY
jgi:hypothetical protein